jgi:hypothetical protein
VDSSEQTTQLVQLITVKYYNEEDVDKIGPALKRVAMWHSHKDSDVGESAEVKCKENKWIQESKQHSWCNYHDSIIQCPTFNC